MKSSLSIALVTVFYLLGSGAVLAQSAPIESNAIISDTADFPREKLIGLIEPAVGMIRGYGYRCDSISAIRPFVFSRGFTVVCNNFNYEYDLSDKGGNWVVELQ